MEKQPRDPSARRSELLARNERRKGLQVRPRPVFWLSDGLSSYARSDSGRRARTRGGTATGTPTSLLGGPWSPPSSPALSAARHRSIRPLLLHSRSDGLCPLPLTNVDKRTALRIKFTRPPSPPPLTPIYFHRQPVSALLLPATTLSPLFGRIRQDLARIPYGALWPPFWSLNPANGGLCS